MGRSIGTVIYAWSLSVKLSQVLGQLSTVSRGDILEMHTIDVDRAITLEFIQTASSDNRLKINGMLGPSLVSSAGHIKGKNKVRSKKQV